MSKININNYESFALDYLEGTMPTEDRRAFDEFLKQHPEIADEMSDLMAYQLEPTIISMPNKDSLTRPESSNKGFRRYAPFLLLLLVVGGLVAFWPTKDSEQLAEQTSQSAKQSTSTKVDPAATAATTLAPRKSKDYTAKEAPQAARLEKEMENLKPISISNESSPKKVETTIKKQKLQELNKSDEAKHASKKVENKSRTNKTSTTANTAGRLNDRHTSDLEVPTTRKSRTINNKENIEKENKQIASNEQPNTNEHKIEQQQKIIEEQVTPITTKDTVAIESPTLEKMKRELNLSKKKKKDQTPIAIQPELSEEGDEIAIAMEVPPYYKIKNKKNKRKKSFFKKLVPEAIAGLTKDELKRSFVPEAIAAAK